MLKPWATPKLLGQKRSKFTIIGQNLFSGQNFLAAQVFSPYRYFIKATTTDIDNKWYAFANLVALLT